MVRTADGFRPSVLGHASGVHEDILMGRETSVEWEDVFCNRDGVKISGSESLGAGSWGSEIEGFCRVGRW